MNLRQLEIFSAVMRFRTTVAAAQELSMSQPAVSNAIKHIESQLGFRLFERVSNRLVPTEEAKILLEEAEPLFMHQQAVKQRAADLKAGRIGRVRIAATAELSESMLPAVVARFFERHPGVHLFLDTRLLNSVLDAVETGLADIGFGMEAHERHALVLEPIAELTLVCVCRSDSPLSALPFVCPADFAHHTLVAPQMSNNIGVRIAEAFGKAAAAYDPMVQVRYLNVGARLAQTNCGATIIDELTAASGHYPGLAIRPFQPEIRLTLSAALPRHRLPSRLAGQFLEMFRAEARQQLALVRQRTNTG